MPKRTSDFRSDLLNDLSDPQEAAQYLNAAVADSAEMVLVALRDIAEARSPLSMANRAPESLGGGDPSKTSTSSWKLHPRQ